MGPEAAVIVFQKNALPSPHTTPPSFTVRPNFKITPPNFEGGIKHCKSCREGPAPTISSNIVTFQQFSNLAIMQSVAALMSLISSRRQGEMQFICCTLLQLLHVQSLVCLVYDVVVKTSTSRRNRIPCVGVEKIYKKVDEHLIKFLAIYLQQWHIGLLKFQ